jgi:hypothetical protein
MKILLNGDSNMCGEELEDRSLGIAPQLCNLLGYEGINLSLSGSSNDRIYDTTMDYIKNNPAPDLIVIGWSEYARVQWFLTDQGYPEWLEINNLGVGKREPPAEYNLRLQHWHQTADNFEYRLGLTLYWHQRIYNLHKYLEYLKIPHVFFNAFHDFKVNQIEFQLDWNNKFMNPYDQDNTYVQWCTKQGYQEITPGWYHYEPAGQRAWAEKLHAYIKDQNIV